MTVLLGRTSAGTTTDFSTAGRTAAWDFVATGTGNLARIFAQTKQDNTGTGQRLGIYANSAGAPGARLGVGTVDTGDPTGTGLFSAPISPTVAITSGTTYWLAWYQLGDPYNFLGDAAGNYKETQVAADFPDPFGMANTSTVNAIIWGEDAPVVEPDLPRTIQRRMRPAASYR